MPSILWRRLDAPGHDACRLERRNDGWTIEGAAVFDEGSGPARLTYVVECDEAWQTRRGDVRGWIGDRAIAHEIVRSDSGWTFDGAVVALDTPCLDLDLGFTPATNLLQMRRIALADGQSADVPVAWLDSSTDALEVLHQRYERRTAATYWYEAARFGYSALLEVRPDGFIGRYPGLWEAEP